MGKEILNSIVASGSEIAGIFNSTPNSSPTDTSVVLAERPLLTVPYAIAVGHKESNKHSDKITESNLFFINNHLKNYTKLLKSEPLPFA